MDSRLTSDIEVGGKTISVLITHFLYPIRHVCLMRILSIPHRRFGGHYWILSLHGLWLAEPARVSSRMVHRDGLTQPDTPRGDRWKSRLATAPAS